MKVHHSNIIFIYNNNNKNDWAYTLHGIAAAVVEQNYYIILKWNKEPQKKKNGWKLNFFLFCFVWMYKGVNFFFHFYYSFYIYVFIVVFMHICNKLIYDGDGIFYSISESTKTATEKKKKENNDNKQEYSVCINVCVCVWIK